MIYAIGADKRHYKVCEDSEDFEAPPGAYRMVRADPGGWIEWDGGECPLPGSDGVQVKTNIGITNAGPAGEFRWSRQSRSGDIIAYRPILSDASEPEPCRFHDDDNKACETYSGQVPCEPEPPAWGGEGLPPVGSRVEIEDGSTGTVLAAAHLKRQGSRVWIELDDGDQRIPSVCCIRPIRSEEDRFVDEVNEVMKAEELFGLDRHARALYRAGYRKEGS